MRLKTYLLPMLLIASFGGAFAQEEELHKDSRQEMEAEVLKHRKDVMRAMLRVPTPETPFDFFNFYTHGSTVTLVGFTIRPTLKTDMGGAVKRLPWVKNVLNEIQVLPLNPEDRDIRGRVLGILRRLLPQSFPQNRANIRIRSLRGDVTLIGYIGEFQKKEYEAALVQVQHVPLVRKVTDDVAVQAKK